jgi:hypothetical protein
MFCDGFVLKHNARSFLPHGGRVVVKVGLPLGAVSTMRLSFNESPFEETSLTMLTPKQIRSVRKEMLRRRALQAIDTVYWTDGPISENSSNHSTSVDKRRQIADHLLNRSFVQIRGVVSMNRPDDTRIIRNVAERLALEVQMELCFLSSPSTTVGDGTINPVVHIVEIKGRMVTFLLESETSPLSNPTQVFHLRTTGKQKNWIKRPKALRDSAGQIIK